MREKNREEIGIYPAIKLVFLYSRCLFCMPYQLEAKLVESKFHLVIQLLLTICSGFVMGSFAVDSLLELSLSNPYGVIGQLHRFWMSIYWIIHAFNWSAKMSNFKKIFPKLILIENRIGLSEKQKNYIMGKLISWMAIFSSSPFIYLICGPVLSPPLSPILMLKIPGIIWAVLYPLVPDIPLWTILTACACYTDNVNAEIKRNSDAAFGKNRFLINRDWAQEKLRNLRFLLGEVNNLKEDVNKLYENRIFLDVAHIFIELVYFIIGNLVMIKFSGDFRSVRYAFIFSNYWMALHCWRFLQLVNISTDLSESGGKTPIMLHQLYTDYIEVGNELLIFSAVLLHRKNDINAKGFLNINYNLIFTVLSGVVMNTIVLLQFHFPDYQTGARPVEDIMLLIRV